MSTHKFAQGECIRGEEWGPKKESRGAALGSGIIIPTEWLGIQGEGWLLEHDGAGTPGQSFQSPEKPLLRMAGVASRNGVV